MFFNTTVQNQAIMGAFKYIMCLSVAFLLSIVPIIPAVRDAIVDFF
jgi:hypothetical protein